MMGTFNTLIRNITMGFPPLFLAGQPTVTRLMAAALAGGLVFASPTVLADEASSEKTTWGLGLGVVNLQKPYTGVDRDTSVLPLLHIENRYVRFFGTTLEAKLPGLQFSATNRINVRLLARWEGAGYEADDSWALEGMAKRKSGLWAGAKVEWQTSLANISADWTHDVAGNSDGQRFSLNLERSWQPGERFTLTPRIGALWHDNRYVDYYYGVRADEVRNGRPAYRGESGINTEVGLLGVYRFNERHSLMFDIRARHLAAAVTDSPLVDRSTENRVFLGYLYHF
ncbi:outer membrane protein [Raoultella sp. BIGb0138]|uniref:MipA/OmpV family protein n=1 Tax=Raoultella sp. BIGb0138 TaxID=2485115 RepID=UPI0010F0A5B6|nr:MipA/OmpV family protein [Raoultella sp. BIGb0138]TCW09957.1 outer membrane protein [Raoultella sp. BIGb0138]